MLLYNNIGNSNKKKHKLITAYGHMDYNEKILINYK